MRKHMTQAELLRIERLIRSGVTDPAEIQEQVMVHAECIQQVLTKSENTAARNAAAEGGEKPTPRRRRKKSAAAEVDPLS